MHDEKPSSNKDLNEQENTETETLSPEQSDQDTQTPHESGETESEIESLSRQLEEANNKALRALAEAQNIQRRAQQDVEKAHKFALEKFSSDLLVVVDNLERALQAVDTENDAMKPVIEGIELTLKSFIDTLSKHGIQQIDPHGEPFDPNFHQAITLVPNPELEPNTVMDVMQKGYVLSGRLIRPAMVVVSKN
ncbi:MAG: nucleotide exchange factor GrpE [Pseudomonadales bacterium]|nr:nucleotide exchange factor GrpE [Pseudomonadales bacterium]